MSDLQRPLRCKHSAAFYDYSRFGDFAPEFSTALRHCRGVHGKLFAFLANGQSPAEPPLESGRLEPGLQQVQYHLGRRQGPMATEANLATGRKPSHIVAIVLEHDEGSLRKIIFSGDLVQQGVI